METPNNSDETPESLLDELKSADPDTQWQAVRAIQEMGEDGQFAIPQLLSMLRTDDDEDMRTKLAEALTDLGPPPTQLLGEIPNLYEVPSIEARDYATYVIEAEKKHAELMLPELIRIVESSDAAARRFAIYGLGLLGAGARPALPILKRIAEQAEDAEAQSALEAISSITEDG